MKTIFSNFSKQFQGEFYYSAMMKSLYATDASVYSILPLAVALPKTNEDIKKLIYLAQKYKLSLIPRAAGTSLAGQCVGEGIVVDISKYFNNIIHISPNEDWIVVQPGVIRDQLNLFLKPYKLFFGPNTSTSNRATIGGMVGNNSCGSTSIVYGSTRDHVLELKGFLSDGSEVVFKELTVEEFKKKAHGNTLEANIYKQIHKELSDNHVVQHINSHFPKPEITRRNTGYAVDQLLRTQPFTKTKTKFNFSKLLAGSEGTLAFITEIKIKLSPLPKSKEVLVALHFNSIEDSLKATLLVMNYKPTACELIDKTILDCTKSNIQQQRNRFFIDGNPKAILLVEFRSDTLAQSIKKANQLIDVLKKEQLGYAFPIIKYPETQSVWELREAGLGLLANIPGNKKAVACIEDTAVSLPDLPNYINEFTQIMKTFKQKAVYYAHAGAGELHLRPVLNLKKDKDVKQFRFISEASAKLVKKYRGSLSGEHGDGRARSEFIPMVLGRENYNLFKRIKGTWDPYHIFNPDKIVNAKPMHLHLRYETDRVEPKLETTYNFKETDGILKTVEKCNGSGDCRKLNFAGGIMCPSYRVTLNEKDSTRGRANVLRTFLTQNTKSNPFNHPEIKAALDLCLSCKGCKSECPSNIDMATLKAEFLHQYYKSNPIPLRSKLIAYSNKLNTLAVKFSGIHNLLIKAKWFKSVFGIAQERYLPKLHGTTLKIWYKKHKLYLEKKHKPKRKLYFFCDEYTNFYDLEIGIKTIKLLYKLGYSVLMLNHHESGRAFISKGFLKQAQRVANKNVLLFKDLVSKETPLVGIEPSTILSFRDEYPNLVNSEYKENAIKLKKNVLLIDEFIASEIDEGHITKSSFKSDYKMIYLHGHCHQNVLSSMDYTLKLLNFPKHYTATLIDSGCCGMAGSFGYEKEHYQLSQDIGALSLFPSIKKAPSRIVIAANGTSCRHQIFEGTFKKAFHPIEVLYDALK